MFEKVTKSFSYGAHTVTLETGEIARQADGAVLCSIGDTVVLATVVARKEAKPGQDFFPLTVDYVEKTYAAGRIPGGFFKREGRPSEKETLTSRLIDRPLRPLFPDGFYNEVQVVIHVLSVDAEIDPDIPALIGASAAMSLSGIPFKGPIGAARVGYVDGQYVINPTATQLKTSQLNLVVAGTERAVLMVESEADQLPEDVMLGRCDARPPADAGRDQRDSRSGARCRQAGVGMAAGGEERGADGVVGAEAPVPRCARRIRCAASRRARIASRKSMRRR